MSGIAGSKIILAIDGSPTSSEWLWTLFWIAVIAAVGGGIIFVGLLFEKLADKKWFSGNESRRRWDTIKFWAEIAVMIGVAVEVITAVGLAWRGEYENRKMSEAQRNAPITEMSATVVLFVRGEGFNDLANWNGLRVATLNLCGDDIMHTPNFDRLSANNFGRNIHHQLFGEFSKGYREYEIEFHSENFMWVMGVEMQVKSVDDVNLLRLDLNFLPRGSEIAGGGVELVVNNLHKNFKILPQADTNFPDGMPYFPYIMSATNVHEGYFK